MSVLFAAIQRQHKRKGCASGAPFVCYLAAAAAVVVAAVAVAAAQQIAAAVAQQDEDQDDPANITAAETIIVTHNQYLRNFVR